MEYTDEERKQFALAQDRSRSGDTQGVAEVLRKLVRQRPDSALFAATLANALNTLGEIDDAEAYFARAVLLSPKSEKISLGFFHCLWGRGKQVEALDEMRRFLTLADSSEYRAILEGLPKAD